MRRINDTGVSILTYVSSGSRQPLARTASLRSPPLPVTDKSHCMQHHLSHTQNCSFARILRGPSGTKFQNQLELFKVNFTAVFYHKQLNTHIVTNTDFSLTKFIHEQLSITTERCSHNNNNNEDNIYSAVIVAAQPL